ncbi:hypothetical protein AY599_21585 [Leptolyngbya valderiana BDU 20041]|nr:hypothetical protein AY599_21585 [Leptolyngbya valderiana BDU 20041]
MNQPDRPSPVEDPVAVFEAALAERRARPLYLRYREIRDWVLRLASAEAPEDTPSAYWREELGGFDYILDASPLILEKLRHHSYHLTGLKVYDYRSGKDDRIPAFAAKMAMLETVAGGRDLFVPEATELGGFGFEIGGALVNVDTLKFWEVMIALDKAAVLGGLREAEAAGERPVVWEIGAGWGGFARVFKTLMPGATYAIVDLPETMLFSALYLGHLFPEAKIHLYMPGGPAPDWTADFLFFAHTELDALRPPRLDLALNMVSFQEMTAAQVRSYVEAAWERGAPFLYSLNRERSPYNTELESVSAILGERFWPHEIPVLDLPYTRLPEPGATQRVAKARDAGAKSKKTAKEREAKPAAKTARGYRHIVGWRKSEP